MGTKLWGLTNSHRLALAHRLHDADDATRLERRLEPVGRVLHVSHVDSQAAVLTQEDHGSPLLLVAGCVTDSHHVLDLEEREGSLGTSKSGKGPPKANLRAFESFPVDSHSLCFLFLSLDPLSAPPPHLFLFPTPLCNQPLHSNAPFPQPLHSIPF